METRSIDYFVDKIRQWHHDRNLIAGSTDKDQTLKLMQELGELSDSICKGKDFRDDFATAYLADLIVYPDDFHHTYNILEKYFKELKSKGLKLKLQKCSFFQEEVKFLGRIVSREVSNGS